MSPIRVGIIGLSADSSAHGAGWWGVSAHFPCYASPHYELVAVCNSSVESARKSIAAHKLPATTRAYGQPEDLAADPGVDLVVVSVVVMKHLMLANPALLANKSLFVEWPLGASTAEAEEMERLAREQGLRTMVGLQFRADPFILKAKQLVDSGVIGKVTSSNVLFHHAILPLGCWAAGGEYYLDFASGGNGYHVGFAHVLDTFTFVLGDFKSTQTLMKTSFPTIKLIDFKTGNVADPAAAQTAPDHVFLQGELSSGAFGSIQMRRTHRSIDGSGLRWLITGTEGEIELTLDGYGIQIGVDPQRMRMTVGSGGETKEVDFAVEDEPGHIKNLNPPAKNVGRLYEAFAKGEGYADFSTALKLHRLLDDVAKQGGFM